MKKETYIYKGKEVKVEDVTTPIWPTLLIGVITTIIYAIIMTSAEPVLSDEEISEQVDKIEEVSYNTYNTIKVEHDFIGRDNVQIEYSEDGSVASVVDEDYYQSFKVNEDSNLTEKEKDEELKRVQDAFGFVGLNRAFRARRQLAYAGVFIPILTIFFSLTLHGLNRQNIKKLEKYGEIQE